MFSSARSALLRSCSPLRAARLASPARAFSSTPLRLDAPLVKPVYTPLADIRPAADGVVLSETNRAEQTFGRFWKTVNLDPTPTGIQILLDSRPLRTPGGKPLLIPSERKATAFLIAHEWDTQKQLLKNHALPLTSLASRAIDALSSTTESTAKEITTADQTRKDVCAALLKYFDTDTICFHEEAPHNLVRLQAERWDPILTWARERFGVEVKVHESLFNPRQPDATHAVLSAHILQYDPWRLAALERAVYTTKSFLTGLALIEGRLTVEEASLASHVEVDSQITVWGEVEDTHDVDYQDVRRKLGSVKVLLIGEQAQKA